MIKRTSVANFAPIDDITGYPSLSNRCRNSSAGLPFFNRNLASLFQFLQQAVFRNFYFPRCFFRSSTRRRTPWAAGCWGPKLMVKLRTADLAIPASRRLQVQRCPVPAGSTACVSTKCPMTSPNVARPDELIE